MISRSLLNPVFCAFQHPPCSQPSVLHTEYLTSHSQLLSRRASHSLAQACLPQAGCLRSMILGMPCATESYVKLVSHPDSWAQSSDALMWWVWGSVLQTECLTHTGGFWGSWSLGYTLRNTTSNQPPRSPLTIQEKTQLVATCSRNHVCSVERCGLYF